MILPGLALWPSRDMPLLLSRLLDYDAQVKTIPRRRSPSGTRLT